MTADALTLIARINAVHNALDALKGIDAITYYRVENDGDRVVVSAPVTYEGGDQNRGYDSVSEARFNAAAATMRVLGLLFFDAGTEEGGEYWIFRA